MSALNNTPQPDSIIDIQDQEQKENNQNNIPQSKDNTTNIPPESQNDQPYLLPPPQENNIQSINNIPNEIEQNLLDKELINSIPPKKRVQIQIVMCIYLFCFTFFYLFIHFILYIFINDKKKKTLKLISIISTLVESVLKIILSIMILVQIIRKKTTRNKSIFVFSLIIIIYSFICLTQIFGFLVVGLIIMIFITIGNSPFEVCICDELM